MSDKETCQTKKHVRQRNMSYKETYLTLRNMSDIETCQTKKEYVNETYTCAKLSSISSIKCKAFA